tara:strand:+ start:72 stop:590 length:519 start_codon:yes stop_codon:yes gene_type:complete
MTPSIWQILIVLFILGIPIILALLLIKKVEYSELSGNQKYAGFWHRFLAGIIDLIIIYVGTFVIFFVIGLLVSSDVATILMLSANVIGFIVSLFYYVLFQSSSKQATPSMMTIEIKIYNENLQRVGFWRLTLRYFSTILSNIILGIGFFMIGWTKRKQGLHDMIARTIHLKE